MVWHQDEPIVSTGPYAQWCVMRLAQPKVTVLLNGQGGDELLAGYVPYQYVYLRELLQQRKLGAVHARGVGVARRAEAAGQAAPRRPSAVAADQAAAAARALRRPRAAAVPAVAGRHEAPAGRRPPDVLAAVAAALRGPQLDGVLDGVAPAVPRPGAGRLGVAAAAVGARRPRAGAGPSCATACGACSPRRCAPAGGRSGSPRPRPAGCALGARVVQGLFRSPQFCARPYWDARRAGRHVRPVLRGRGRAVADLLARDQHRDLDARVLRPRRRVAARRRARFALHPHRRRVARGAQRTRRGRAGAVLRARPASPVRAFDRRRSRLRACTDPHAAVRERRLVARRPHRRVRATSSSPPDDVVAVSEKAVAICQGRSYPVDEVQRPAAGAHAVAVRRSHRVGHRPRHPRHHGARDPRGGRGAHPRRHRRRRGHQAVRREGRVLPGGRSRGARHRRPDPRHHPAVRRPRQDGSRRSRGRRARAGAGARRRRRRSSTPTTSA